MSLVEVPLGGVNDAQLHFFGVPLDNVLGVLGNMFYLHTMELYLGSLLGGRQGFAVSLEGVEAGKVSAGGDELGPLLALGADYLDGNVHLGLP